MTTVKRKIDSDTRRFLVWGYIRAIEKAQEHLEIPFEIYEIIYLYQRFLNAWGEQYKAECIAIDTNKSMITVDTDSGVTVYGEEVIKEGIHKWRVAIVSIQDDGIIGDSFPHIGIVENDDKLLKKYITNVNFDDFGHLLCGGNRAVYSFSKRLEVRAKFFWKGNGDILDIKLDLNNGKLYLKMNDSDSDELCIDVETSPKGYRFALAVRSKGQFQFMVQ